MTRLAAALVLATCAGLSAGAVRTEIITRDAYLMGTRARLVTMAVTRADGLATLASALEVLERTEVELSTWRDSSAISALNRHPAGSPWQAAPALCRMFTEVWRWHAETGGAFDPAIGRLLGAWDVHGSGRRPTADAQRQAAAASGLSLVAFDRTGCTLTRRGDVAIDAGAFGKGEALDRVEAVLGDAPWMIDLGGQVAVGGDAPDGGWTVAVADPRHRDRPLLHVRLVDGSLSTSGGSERDLTVDGGRIAHIFDPRTRTPATFGGSVTVWHRSGLAADALSTALFVMGPDEGRRWADARGIAALYLVPGRGGATDTVATRAFRERFSAPE